MSKYRASKDVYCPHTGRLLFHRGYVYEDISSTDGDIVLTTHYRCEVSKYTITGEHCNMEGFFTKVKVSKDFNRSFTNRTGGIGALELMARRFSNTGIDVTFNLPYYNEKTTFFASLGADDCDKVANYFYELGRWIREGE